MTVKTPRNYIARVKDKRTGREIGHCWGKSPRTAILAVKRRYPCWYAHDIVVEYFNCTLTSIFDSVTLSDADRQLLH